MSKPPKAVLKVLERIFSREIDGSLPLQSKAKIYEKLDEKDGLVARMVRKFGGRFPCEVKGYELTHLGRLIYCSS